VSFEVARDGWGAVVVLEDSGSDDGNRGNEESDEDAAAMPRQDPVDSHGKQADKGPQQEETGADDFRMGLTLGGGIAECAGDVRVTRRDHTHPEDKGRKDNWGRHSTEEQSQRQAGAFGRGNREANRHQVHCPAPQLRYSVIPGGPGRAHRPGPGFQFEPGQMAAPVRGLP
jgi:hypothetical protein